MSEVSELMGRDPLSLTKEDRTAIIVYFRENRIRFIQGTKSAGSPKATAKAAKEPKGDPLPGLQLSLDDLGL